MNEDATCNELWTIGHSTRSIEDFIGLLTKFGITRLIDIRTIPFSRHNPQFNRDTVAASLAGASITYSHLPALGGRRRARPDSKNRAWKNSSFRGYADYMETPIFQEGLEELIEHARMCPTAIMCAEAVPWRCHRSLVGDALVARGWRVLDIINEETPRPHRMSPWAKVQDGTVSYPGPEEALPGL